MKCFVVRIALTAVLLAIVPVIGLCAVDDWKKEFADICSKTESSMSLTSDELKALVARSDKLRTVIDSQDESTKKVYRKRLQLCRDLYDYVLKSREQDKK
jgi:hypothetical protein